MDTKNIDELKGDPKNPRFISKHDGEALARSMSEFGDLSCIVFNIRTQQLVGGHQRINILQQVLSGAKQITITTRFDVPDQVGTTALGYVVYENRQFAYRGVDWDEGRQKAANIAANRIQGEFNLDMLAQVNYEISQLENGADLLAQTGQMQDEIDRLLDMVGAGSDNTEDDEAPEVDDVNPPLSKFGEIYQLGRHRLMCGDSTDFGMVSDLMDGREADMVFTDPPYNVAYEGKTKDALTIQNDSMGDKQFFEFLLSVHNNLSEVTKPGGALYVCHADSEGLNFRKAFIESGFLLKQCIIWVKQSMVMGRQDYQWQHEPILYGWKEGGSHYFIDDRTQTTIWNIDIPSRNEEHPTMKPIDLCKRAILNSSKRNELVIDLFGGSGSTLIACETSERICYTMELDPKYCDVIRKRYARHINREADWQEATPCINKAEINETPTTTIPPVA